MFRQLLTLAVAALLVAVGQAFHIQQPTNVLRFETRLGMFDPTTVATHMSDLVHSSSLVVADALSDVSAPPETGGISYSKASYYTVLGLYLISFPGLWSTIKRSTKAKVKRKTFVTPGEASSDPKAMSLRQQAGEIMACKCKFT